MMQKSVLSPYLWNCLMKGSIIGGRKVAICNAFFAVRKYSTLGDDYLYKRKLPTDHFQKSMPHLPIPALAKTCSRYLDAQRPLLSSQQYQHIETITKEFESGEGKVLNDELVARDKANKNTSYITEPWFDMYLKARDPVVLNYNPYMVFKDDPKPVYNNQLIRATNMLVSSMRFMKTMRANILEPEVYHLNPAKSDTATFRNVLRLFPKSLSWYGAYFYKAFPLDMSQFVNLFSSTRIPRMGKDELIADKDARHVLVIRNGHMYTFDVLNPDGDIIAPTEILSHVQYILNLDATSAETPLGHLTTENRDTWANVRQHLVDIGNEEQLAKLDSAVFALVLEDHIPTDPIDLSRLFLHGDAANRWFDKSFSLIMAKDGQCSVNFEHSWGDGVAVLRYFNEVFKESTQRHFVHPDTKPANVDSSEAVTRLDFKVDDKVKDAVKSAQNEFNRNVNALKFSFTQLDTYGKALLKTEKLSADSVMQLAFQIAHYRLYGKTAATYESCSTAAFKHGRTETIRSCTDATKKTSEMFEKTTNRPSVNDLRNMLTECSNYHGKLTKEAAMGQGFDRHLFGIKHLAEELGQDLPALYKDPAYSSINNIILSTSTLSSPAVSIGGFAPVSPDGLGIGYGIEDNSLGCNVTSYETKDVEQFVQCVNQTLQDIHCIIQGRDFKN